MKAPCPGSQVQKMGKEEGVLACVTCCWEAMLDEHQGWTTRHGKLELITDMNKSSFRLRVSFRKDEKQNYSRQHFGKVAL